MSSAKFFNHNDHQVCLLLCLPNVFPYQALAPAGQIWLESSKSWFSSRNEYLHWAHAVFTVVKEIDGRFRICNNLDLIEHSAFVTTPANRTRRPGIQICLNHKCRVSYQIEIIADPKPYINFLCDCENHMRSMQIAVSGWAWPILTIFWQIRPAGTITK